MDTHTRAHTYTHVHTHTQTNRQTDRPGDGTVAVKSPILAVTLENYKYIVVY